MKITHLSNSFINVELNGTKIVCDPWVGIANHGGWHAYPEFDESELIALVSDADYVYISHVHSDHFDPDFLVKAGLTKKIFIIKEFAHPILKNRLLKLGVQTVLELKAFEKFELAHNNSLAIIPQLTSNSSGLEDSINYDLDTSIIFSDGIKTFFNQVDNPLSEKNYEQVRQFIADHFGDLDVACLVCGAASEYPQCFIGIDREGEKNRIIEASLKKIKTTVDILKPKVTFIAGGSYFIPGKYSILNGNIAQPTFEQIKNILNPETETLYLEGGKQINMEFDQPAQLLLHAIEPLRTMSESIKLHAQDLYPYQERAPNTLPELRAAFDAAKTNYFKKIQDTGLHLDTSVKFIVYEDIQFSSGLVIQSSPICELELDSTVGESYSSAHILIHIDSQAIYECLCRLANWNQTLSGSLCLFERNPNIHKPEVLFSLNYLVA